MLITLLGGTELAREVQQNTQYYPDPPVRSAIPPAPQCPLVGVRPDGVEAIGQVSRRVFGLTD
jgi:cyclohexyl-isocyanide hydratase